jgi:hypothetical protein
VGPKLTDTDQGKLTHLGPEVVAAHIWPALTDGASTYAAAYREPLMSDLTAFVCCLYGAMLSARSKHRRAEIIAKIAPIDVRVFEPHRTPTKQPPLLCLDHQVPTPADAPRLRPPGPSGSLRYLGVMEPQGEQLWG